jgi:hypothetical protein
MDTGVLFLGIGAGLIFYVYMAICIMFIAQKTGTKYPWLAWIPIANVFLMAMIAKKPWWWALIIVLAYVIAWGAMNGNITWLGFLLYIVVLVFAILIWVPICQARSRPGWWVIFLLIPIVNLVFIGILAFS